YHSERPLSEFQSKTAGTGCRCNREKVDTEERDCRRRPLAICGKEVCMLCSKRDSSMGIIVCAADDVKLSEQIFKVTQYRVPELPAILSPVCDGCRSQIVQCDQVPPISVTATDNKYPTVLLNVEPNDPLAVPESVQKLYRRNYVPAEEWRKHLAGNLMKIFQHMCKLCGTVVRSMEKHSAEHQIGDIVIVEIMP
uniref:Uncharacterized protein n=1 Tax=Anopheles albimanus TaxID=7167 RepID=A0A182F4R9_ANOAL